MALVINSLEKGQHTGSGKEAMRQYRDAHLTLIDQDMMDGMGGMGFGMMLVWFLVVVVLVLLIVWLVKQIKK